MTFVFAVMAVAVAVVVAQYVAAVKAGPQVRVF